MELHQLRYLVAVGRTGNFSRAAEQCHVAQPSLSQQIAKLEAELGEPLFDRLKTCARPTAAGLALIRRAGRILAEVDAAQRDAADARGLARGQVAVGLLPSIAPYFLRRVLPDFRRRFPGIELVIQEDTTARLLQLLATCEIDLAIASLPIADDRMATATLFSEELRVALPPGHRLAGRRRLEVADLESERFILLQEGHCLGDQVLNFCTRRDFRPNVLCRGTQIETLRALVRAGMGISLLPEMACPDTPAARRTYRRLGPPSPQRTIAAVWLAARPPGRAASAFLDHLRAVAAG